MKRIDIRDKLEQLDFSLDDVVLGDFDLIGEYTAKKSRDRNSDLYKEVGCFFRPNYERGILIYHLIKRFEIRNMLEVGFGRGYASFCAAKAMCDMGFADGKVHSVDPNVDQKHLENLAQVFPKEWFEKLFLMKGTLQEALPQLPEDQKFELIYIDGDHTYDAVKSDWELSRDRYDKFILFDDYDEESNPNIQVKQLIDELDLEKELIISDRRIFFDDRRIPDDEISYGQVLVQNPDFDSSSFLLEW